MMKKGLSSAQDIRLIIPTARFFKRPQGQKRHYFPCFLSFPKKSSKGLWNSNVRIKRLLRKSRVAAFPPRIQIKMEMVNMGQFPINSKTCIEIIRKTPLAEAVLRKKTWGGFISKRGHNLSTDRKWKTYVLGVFSNNEVWWQAHGKWCHQQATARGKFLMPGS